MAEIQSAYKRIVSDSTWKVNTAEISGWKAVGFDDSLWPNATEHYLYSAVPYGADISGIDNRSPAKWIWSADKENHNTVRVQRILQ